MSTWQLLARYVKQLLAMHELRRYEYMAALGQVC